MHIAYVLVRRAGLEATVKGVLKLPKDREVTSRKECEKQKENAPHQTANTKQPPQKGGVEI